LYICAQIKRMASQESKDGRQEIVELLKQKACTKQELYGMMQELFKEFKKQLKDIATYLESNIGEIDKRVSVEYEEQGGFEANLKFSGDILLFTMHSNIFSFNENHQIHKSAYVESDSRNQYFGMLQIHNFLADSFKYKRMNDLGYLIGRIFVNREKHFFVEGKRQLGFMFNNIDTMILNETYIKSIIEAAIVCALDFELLVPPFDKVRELTVFQKIQQQGNASFKTGKRLGFELSAQANDTNIV